jgi:putative heme iron utilization protein
MAETQTPEPGAPRAGGEAPDWESRKLLRAARSGVLATQTGGQPFASLVTPASAPDLSPLLLLSDLSEHTRHLRAEPRCALIVAAAPAEANPQTAPRVTVTATADFIDADDALKARWVAIHPYAAFYADFGDFHLVRLRIQSASYVGGFARAFRLPAVGLLPDPAAVAAVAAAEPGIIAHCNDDHPDALAAIAAASGGAAGPWRMVASDVDGCDLAQDATVLRIAWPAPVADAAGVREALVRLAREARARGLG